MFPLRLCGGEQLVAVTRERLYCPSRLRVKDDDDDECCGSLPFLRHRRENRSGKATLSQ